MTKKNISIRCFIFRRVILLALCVCLLLSYQGTQSFLKGIEVVRKRNMILAAEYLPANRDGFLEVLEYHVASDWQLVPEHIKTIFPEPPNQPGKMLTHFENWWYFAPPEKSYSLIMTFSSDNTPVYVSYFRDFSASHPYPEIKHHLQDPMVQMALTGLSVLLIFTLLIYWTFRNLSHPAQVFYQWTKKLNLLTAAQQRPDFQFQELNSLSELMQQNVDDLQQALTREKEFLAYASHELRTPITVLLSDSDLLDKVCQPQSDKEKQIRSRIRHSGLTMKAITETLLWLSRDTIKEIPVKHVDIAGVLNQEIGRASCRERVYAPV